MDATAITTTLQLLGGLLLLVGGAELLVRGAVGLAAGAGLSRLVIGLTVVAWGTSAPELAVSAGAALSDQTDLTVGNVVGSNTFNILVVLGLSALVLPLAVAAGVVRREVPVVIGVSLAAWAMAADGAVGRVDGFVLLAGLAAYTGWAFYAGRKGDPSAVASPEDVPDVDAAAERSAGRVAWRVLQLLAGLALLVGGSRLLVAGATTLARAAGVPELVIGLTVLAVGTSLPEVAASLGAAWRGQGEIAVGNALGSNLVNLLGILGASAVVAPAGLSVGEAARWLDFPVMVAVAAACGPVMFTGGRISRAEGAAFLAAYLAYTVYLVADALDPVALDPWRGAVVAGVAAVAVAGFGTSAWRAWRVRRASKPAGTRVGTADG